MGAGGLRNSGDDSSRSKWFDRLVNKAERGRCSDRKIALRRWVLSRDAFSSLSASQNDDGTSNRVGMDRLRCNKRSKFASSAGWNGTLPVEGLTSGSRTSGLGKRLRNSLTQL